MIKGKLPGLRRSVILVITIEQVSVWQGWNCTNLTYNLEIPMDLQCHDCMLCLLPCHTTTKHSIN